MHDNIDYHAKDKAVMKLKKIIFITTFLLTACTNAPEVGKHGITDEISTLRFKTKYGAIETLINEAIIICWKNGYKDTKYLKMRVTEYKDSTYSAKGVFKCKGEKVYENCH